MSKFISVTSESVLRFLRLAHGMSQRDLAYATGLSEQDIASFEGGSRLLSIGSVLLLAGFFNVSCEALLNDSFADIVANFSDPITVQRKRLQSNHLTEVGDDGEIWVTEQERQRLIGTPYANAVNPGYAIDGSTHFDIMSFSKDGTPCYIEVKATHKGENTPFFMTDQELEFIHECLYNNRRYELHRVYRLGDPERCGCRIYSARELLEEFQRTPNRFKMEKKEVAV